MSDQERFFSVPGCHVCGGAEVVAVPGYSSLKRVTSDCKPWTAGGWLGVCRTCGCAQKAINATWQAEVQQIYANYSIYHQSGGIEQAVFEMGQAQSRSERLLKCLQTHISLPDVGRLLDVGCGNGAFLRTFSRFTPRWSLAGTELSDKYRRTVENIERVEALYTSLVQVPGVFHLISLIHVLEHVSSPVDFLFHIRDKLDTDGRLLIEVPHYLDSPFDLLIADHSTHFGFETLVRLVRQAGYEPMTVATNWVAKELTLVARKHEAIRLTMSEDSFFAFGSAFAAAVQGVRWLESVVAAARKYASAKNFGLFGTSIAATWLFSELEGCVEFFVDEDPHRIGQLYMERPIYHPRDVPSESRVFLAFPILLAESILQRLARPGLVFCLPPAWDER